MKTVAFVLTTFGLMGFSNAYNESQNGRTMGDRLHDAKEKIKDKAHDAKVKLEEIIHTISQKVVGFKDLAIFDKNVGVFLHNIRSSKEASNKVREALSGHDDLIKIMLEDNLLKAISNFSAMKTITPPELADKSKKLGFDPEHKVAYMVNRTGTFIGIHENGDQKLI